MRQLQFSCLTAGCRKYVHVTILCHDEHFSECDDDKIGEAVGFRWRHQGPNELRGLLHGWHCVEHFEKLASGAPDPMQQAAAPEQDRTTQSLDIYCRDVEQRIAGFVLNAESVRDLMDLTDPNDPVGVACTRLADAIRDGKWRP